MTLSARPLGRSALLTVLTLLAAQPPWGNVAMAHPLSQGSADVVVHPDRVEVRARVTLEEVAVTDMLTTAADEAAAAAGSPAAAYDRHARYLAAHLHVSADGQPLTGTVAAVAGPATRPGSPAGGADKDHAVYTLEYRQPATPSAAAPAGGAAVARPRRVEIRHSVLVGVQLAPGLSWETSYVVRIAAAGSRPVEGLLLTPATPVEYTCDWTAADGTAATGPAAAHPYGPAGERAAAWRLAANYARHGVHHILTGYDHLLFVTALVLAATGLWDLVKVVSAFTLAHTLTLALSALDVVRLPSWVVEPMIAASIVFVAAQNVLWPGQSRGRVRLAAAFAFGLFHGLGYAGGLVEAMDGMSGRTVLLALAAFSVGVEVGHQVVVLPLFGLLKLGRQAAGWKRAAGGEPPAADGRPMPLALRYGSAAIGLAGVYYFVAAVGSGLAATPAP